jgi:hypothetical protein
MRVSKFRAEQYAKYIALPEDDPERVAFEQDHWIGGSFLVCQWQLSVLAGRDLWSLPLEAYGTALVEFCRSRLPGVSCAALARSDYSARIYLQDLRRRAGSTIFGPLKKPDRAVILLLKNPDWTDEQIAERVPTTLKQLRRFSTYNHLRSEIRFEKRG